MEVRNVSKEYPKFKLEDVSFAIYPGKITGFIGRNGAGKTTTLKCIYQFVKYAGEIFYCGEPIENDVARAKNEIGLLFGGIDYYPAQKVKTLSKVTARFYDNWDADLFNRLLAYFNIDPEKQIKQLSNGMRVKYNLSVALSHGAKVLLLDEPTSGLDPVSRDELLDCFVRIAKKHNVAILFSTHIISDLDRCADEIVYIQGGRIVDACTVARFKENYLHIEGNVADIRDADKESIGRYHEQGGTFTGIISASERGKYAGFAQTTPSLEEIMLLIERGNEDEESPL